MIQIVTNCRGAHLESRRLARSATIINGAVGRASGAFEETNAVREPCVLDAGHGGLQRDIERGGSRDPVDDIFS